MNILLAGILLSTFLLVAAKRVTALIHAFMLQSLFLFLVALTVAVSAREKEMFAVSLLLLVVKVISIPFFLRWLARKIKIEEHLGMAVNPMLSLVSVMLLTFLAYIFVSKSMGITIVQQAMPFTIALSVTLTGMLLMVARFKAVAQVIGLLAMENGLFLAVVALCGHMPFFVEIAIFFDVLMCALILGIFMYRINELFTHIDVGRLTTLKG